MVETDIANATREQAELR